MIYVIDASAAVEYLLRSGLGLRVEALIDDAEVAAPELLDVEVLAVLRREVLAGRLATPRAEDAIADLRDWDLERISHRALLDHAWSLRENLTAYDALYVAAARMRGASLLTADGPLARAPRLGIVVQDLRIG